MTFLAWIIIGLIAGWLASMVMKTDSAQGPVMDIIMGVVGAFVGGLIMNALGEPGVTGFNIYSLLVATLGAVVTIWIGRRLR